VQQEAGGGLVLAHLQCGSGGGGCLVWVAPLWRALEEEPVAGVGVEETGVDLVEHERKGAPPVRVRATYCQVGLAHLPVPLRGRPLDPHGHPNRLDPGALGWLEREGELGRLVGGLVQTLALALVEHQRLEVERLADHFALASAQLEAGGLEIGIQTGRVVEESLAIGVAGDFGGGQAEEQQQQQCGS